MQSIRRRRIYICIQYQIMFHRMSFIVITPIYLLDRSLPFHSINPSLPPSTKRRTMAWELVHPHVVRHKNCSAFQLLCLLIKIIINRNKMWDQACKMQCSTIKYRTRKDTAKCSSTSVFAVLNEEVT